MKKTLSHISPYATSKVMAILYFVLTALLLFPYAVYFMFLKEWDNAFFSFLAPFFYGILSYILCLVLIFIYNQIAAMVGGIEFTLDDA